MATASTPTVPSFRPAALSPVLIYRPWDKIKGSESRGTGVDSHHPLLFAPSTKLSGVEDTICDLLRPLERSYVLFYLPSRTLCSSLFTRGQRLFLFVSSGAGGSKIEHVASRSTAESKIKESCWLGTGETVHVPAPTRCICFVLDCILFRDLLKSKTSNFIPRVCKIEEKWFTRSVKRDLFGFWNSRIFAWNIRNILTFGDAIP